MRRYRFGLIAAPLAFVHLVVAVAAGVLALVSGDPALLRELVARGWDTMLVPHVGWVELVLVVGGVVQSWALWQVLRGRRLGGPAGRRRAIGLLRAALYLSVASDLLYRLPLPYQWWFGLPEELLRFAIVLLFFVVVAGALPRWLRLVGLVAGLADAVIAVLGTVAYPLGPDSWLRVFWAHPLGNVLHLLWFVPVLAGQARDTRWSVATVRFGVVAAPLSLLSSTSFSTIGIGGGLDFGMVLRMLLAVTDVFVLTWAARSAHELAEAPHPRPRPRKIPSPAPRRPWALAAVAVALPLVPAAVNVAGGMPVWIGPRGAIEEFFREVPGDPAGLLWLAVDVLVGVGALAVLVLVAVVRRTRRLLRATMLSLTLAAAAGVLTALTAWPDEDWDVSVLAEERLRLYPDGLFTLGESGELLFGLSPLWYSAAFAASAIILFFLYAAPPAARLRHHVLVTAAAASVALCLLPVADHARGPVTTVQDCSPNQPWQDARVGPLPPTGPRAFICAVRANQALGLADTTPDQVLLAHGHRLCAAYTRNDPDELARIYAAEGLDVRELYGVLATICPAADADVRDDLAAEDRQFAESDAEHRRKCAAIPRHRPLIKPAKAVRLKEPQWPQPEGVELYDPETGADPYDGVFDHSLENGLVGAGPGHVAVHTHADYAVCVTLETYARRPPVETKGWDHVAEVGYDHRGGRMVFRASTGGIEWPDLSLDGRKGHYRIRVHFAWFAWKGEELGSQRLLIMAYPGQGDKLVTYRKPSRR
ncbi:hypothetical protein [Nonomuraea sp. NPDC049695]|uniref:hypothetical protein n=1 Tax=Nonomuraea sp. NPDC049695 TaxID=3154734 RepID=UPI00344769FC